MCLCGYDTWVLKPKDVKLIPVELKLQAVVSHSEWVLGTKLRSFSRVRSALDSRAISLPPSLVFLCLTLLPGLGHMLLCCD